MIKSFSQLCGLILVLVFTNASAQEANDAGSYLQFIGNQYEEMSKDMMSYASAVAHGKSARKVEKRRVELLQQVKESERNVRRMKPFQKDSRLRDSVAAYFRLCYLVLIEDYGKIVNLEDIAEQSYDAMEAYLLAKETANHKLDEASNRVDTVYRTFASDNQIRLLESRSKLSEMIAKTERVNVYHRTMYLLFFRSYKNEAYFFEAMSRADVSAMEQTSNSLTSNATQDLDKLRSISPFNGDTSLKNICQRLLVFYQKEGNTYFPVFTDFQLKKEGYEKMKKALDAKRPADRNQNEIDAFNKSGRDLNAASQKISSINDECNKNRSILIKSWGELSEDFLSKYTPKYR